MEPPSSSGECCGPGYWGPELTDQLVQIGGGQRTASADAVVGTATGVVAARNRKTLFAVDDFDFALD